MSLSPVEQIDALWWLLATGFIFLGLVSFTQVGLSLIEAGLSRPGFSETVLVKNLAQFCLGGLAWWLLGFGFAFGNLDGGYLGKDQFAGQGWYATLSSLHATTVGFIGISVVFIINCAVTERMQMHIYLLLSFVLMLFVWPVVVAWGWGKGWLYGLNTPFKDDGGVCTVHLFAGTIALAAVLTLQSRIGRWNAAPAPKFVFSSPTLLVIGTILYFLHLCFVNALRAPDGLHRGMAIFNTWLSAGVAGLTAALAGNFLHHSLSHQFLYITRGFIAGAVSAASAAGNCSGWEAFCMGVVTGATFLATLYVMDKLAVDDAAYVTAVHFVPGLIGTFWVGLWDHDTGGFHWASGEQLGSQLAGELSVFGWAAFFSIVGFGIALLMRVLKVEDEVQLRGLDHCELTLEGFQPAEDDYTNPGIEMAVREPWGST